MFGWNRNKENVSCVVSCKGRASTSVAEQRNVFPRRLRWMRLQKRIKFLQPPPFFLWKFCLYCFINAFVVPSRMCNHKEHTYCGTTCSSLLFYNHALSNTNIICFNSEPRERRRSSQWVRAERLGVDCWQERRFVPSPELFTDWEFLMVRTNRKGKILSCI
jgi:hypothetical protein